MHISGRRTGSLWLFGASAQLEEQHIDVKLPAETTPNGLWGSYLGLQTDGMPWNFSADVTFPVGPVLVTISPEIHVRAPTRSDTNDSLKLSPSNSNNSLAPAYRFDSWYGCESNPPCAAPVGPFVFANEILIEHFFVPCPGDIGNFTDGVLPYNSSYGGAGCASTNYLYLNGLNNWFQFGRPSGKLANGEPDHTITSASDPTLAESNATMWASLGVDAKFDVDIVKIELKTSVSLASRDGFAVRQFQRRDADMHHGTVDVWTELNAQSKADAAIKATIQIGGWLPPFTQTFSVSLGDTGNREAVASGPVADIDYTDELHTKFDSYTVKGVTKADPDGARGQCVFGTPVTKSTPNPGDPATFLKQVATNAVNAVHPCNVKTCQPDGLHETDYKWDSTQKKLVVDPTGTHTDGCHICRNLMMNFCDASGNLVSDSGGPINVIQGQAPGLLCIR
jgi:hypothetical protein